MTINSGGTMHKSRYQAIVYKQAEGPWVAEVPGLSGCCALKPTKKEALEELRRVLDELVDWFEQLGGPPERTFVVHGEESAAESFARTLEGRFGGDVTVPDRGQTVELGSL